jgi:hypothetical protein
MVLPLDRDGDFWEVTDISGDGEFGMVEDACPELGSLMFRIFSVMLLAMAGLPAFALPSPLLKTHRQSAGDLEVGGWLRGVPNGETRYVAYADLLRLPQVTYTVTDDTYFSKPTKISGVLLSELSRAFGATPSSDLIVAICYDKYRTNYPLNYMAAHHPLLVLMIDGKTPDQWPRTKSGTALGPYLISHPKFVPAFHVLAHADEPQIPFGVTRIELRSEARVFGAIHPPIAFKPHSQIEDGYRIAQQNCFRCHNSGEEGGQKARRAWLVLSAWAFTDRDAFKRYLRNPLSINPASLMPPSPQYDDATADALAAYFRTFQEARIAK